MKIGKKKNSPEWKESSSNETKLSLGAVLLMGHLHKGKIYDYLVYQ